MRKSFLPLLATFTLSTTLLLSHPFSASAAVPGTAATSTLKDQTGVALTVYNDNLGLVKDQREITLRKGTGELRFMDVASGIIPASVSITSLSDSGSFRILEQNYEYDLLNPQKLLDKYVGKEVQLYQKNPYTEREEIVTATLLSNNGGPIYRIGDGITYGHPGRVILPGVPENLISQPTLVWLVDSDLATTRKIEASYLTSGISWRADYVLTLNEKDTRADFAGWVTLDNKSGTTYRNARLKLVAGDVNRVKETTRYQDRMYKAALAEAAPQFREEGFFEYHIYTLERPSTIKDNQTKQIRLLQAAGIPLKKELLLNGDRRYFYALVGEQDNNSKVGVFLEIENRKSSGLGMPLPKGTIRVYKQDSDGSLQFAGEDAIDHTPKDEKLRVKLGDAFDVVASRKQTDWKKIASDTYEAAFEIILRNHKTDDVVVKVLEPVPGDWSMLSASHPWKKGDAFSAEFSIPVPKDKEAKLLYRVRMRY
ncbi:MAG: DUF4139 domain-containing protein [Geobacteraceae bacterium]|nr:DUF4139 domain-containing protein [Geobacteraceae bacterium]